MPKFKCLCKKIFETEDILIIHQKFCPMWKRNKPKRLAVKREENKLKQLDKIKINGMEFNRTEEYASLYKYDYLEYVRKIKMGLIEEKNLYRTLILNDLWFIIYFVLKIKKANNPFVIRACREVESGPKDYTLDLWAREHFKSSIITIAETVQEILKDPEKCHGIFCYVRPIAKGFLREIKQLLEGSEFLVACFPDILWANPKSEAPKWSEDEGLTVKRKSYRKESTVEAWGLVEGMPTSRHFDRRIYDDIVSEDMAESPDVLNKVILKFDSSQNLGTDVGTHRVTGTIYHHADPHVYLMNLKDIHGDLKYKLRLKPATHNGQRNGEPVLLTQERLDNLKLTKTFNCQQLLDPTPTDEVTLDYKRLQYTTKAPNGLYKFIVIDPAGDDRLTKASTSGDDWAIHLIGVDPDMDELGASDVYWINSYIGKLSEAEAVETIGKMYLNGGMIRCLGYEKMYNTVPGWLYHLENYIKESGRAFSVDPDRGFVKHLSHGSRNKFKRIESALSWPLNNHKIHVCDTVPANCIERLKNEMDKFKYWHDDGLDAFAYLYDLIADFKFVKKDPYAYERDEKVCATYNVYSY